MTNAAPGSLPEHALPVASPPISLERGAEEGVAEPIPSSVLWRVALRSFLLQALWHPERMQGHGFAYALRPVARLVAGREGENRWLARHLGYFNTNPALVGCALGVVSRLETDSRAQDQATAIRLDHLKMALGAGLAAVGDSLFWSTLRPLAAVLGILWFLEGSAYGPLIFLLLYNSFHVYVRFRGVFVGNRAGLSEVNRWLRRRLVKLRVIMQLSGVIACASLVNSLVDRVTERLGSVAVLWMAVGLVLGIMWGEKRRMSPAALGIVIFTVVLAWTTLRR